MPPVFRVVAAPPSRALSGVPRNSPQDGLNAAIAQGSVPQPTAQRVTFLLCTVAAASATVFGALLAAVVRLNAVDWLVIGICVFGSGTAAVIVSRGKVRAGASLAIGSLWTAAVTVLLFHGLTAVPLPALTVACVLVGLWGGSRIAIATICASIFVVVAASGALPIPWPAPLSVSARSALVTIVGQFVFLGVLIAVLSRFLTEIRRGLRNQDDRLESTTRELQVADGARRATEAVYAELVDALPDAVLVLEFDGRIIRANAAIERILGLPASSFEGKRLGEIGLFPPGERERVYEALRRTVLGEQVPPTTLAIHHADGSPRWVEASARVVTNDAGVSRILTLVRDITERRRGEQSRSMLAQAIASAQNGMALASPEGQLTYVNAAFVRLWGYERADQCEGRNVREFWRDPALADELIARLFGGARDVAGMLVALRRDGSTFEVELAANLILGDVGAPVGLMASFTDVTTRVATEHALLKGEAQLRRTKSLARLGGWEVDLGAGVLTWDDEVKRIHEVAPDYVPSVETALDFYAPEARPVIEAAFERLVTMGTPFLLELPLISATGRRLWARAQGEAERREGQIVKVFGIFQDLTELHVAREQLRAAEQRNRVIVESSADLILLLREDRQIDFVSPSSQRLLGVSEDAVLGRDVGEWIHPDDVESATAGLARLLADPEHEIIIQLRLRHADGSWRRLELIGRNMLKVPGLHGIFVMGRDITERDRLEEHLRETQKLESLGRLAGGIAHDFNNLLTAILGYAEELTHELPAGSREAEDVGEIQRAGRRAQELTSQLLTFARRQVIVPRTIDVGQQLEEIQRFLRRLLGADIALEVNAPPATAFVRVDPAQFEQILMNLAANGRDAMPEGGTLRIAMSVRMLDPEDAATRSLPTGPYVAIETSDSGTGMSTEVTSRIFEPFFTTKELGKGTGLGLATVYGIVRQSGGEIEVRSTIGEGTTFTILLPSVEHTPEHATWQDDAPVRGGSETILMVEDEAVVRTYGARVLRNAGYTVLVAADAFEAEQLVERADSPVNLLVTDVVMPRRSGPELADRLTARWPELPVLFVSGYTEERLDERTRLPGAVYLPKPYLAQGLLQRVRALLDASAHRQNSIP